MHIKNMRYYRKYEKSYRRTIKNIWKVIVLKEAALIPSDHRHHRNWIRITQIINRHAVCNPRKRPARKWMEKAEIKM